MPIYPPLSEAYAKAIYINGSKHFSDIRPEYVGPVKQYAADTYYINAINNALAQTWITAQEHADTMALKGPEDPQYEPLLAADQTPPTE